MNSKERYWNVRDYLESFLEEAEPCIGEVKVRGMEVVLAEKKFGSKTTITLDLGDDGKLIINRLVNLADKNQVTWEVYEPFSIGLDANIPVDTFFHYLVRELLRDALNENLIPTAVIVISHDKR